MEHTAIIAGRCLAAIVGILLIYSSIFLYRNEEGYLENVLQVWWQKVRRLHSTSISIEAAFLKVVATNISKLFDMNFGKKLFGIKAIAASICYSFASINLFALLLIYLIEPPNFAPKSELYFIGIAGIFFLTLGSLGLKANQPLHEKVWLTMVFITSTAFICFTAAYSFRDSVFNQSADSVMSGVQISAMIPLGVACDCLFIAFTRQVLKNAASSNSVVAIIVPVIGNFILAIALIFIPAFLSQWLPSHSTSPIEADFVSVIFVFTAFSNFLDAVVASIFFAAAVLMLVHRLIWPIIERPLHALFRYRVFSEKKKIIFFIGLGLVCFASPKLGEKLVNYFHSILG